MTKPITLVDLIEDWLDKDIYEWDLIYDGQYGSEAYISRKSNKPMSLSKDVVVYNPPTRFVCVVSNRDRAYVECVEYHADVMGNNHTIIIEPNDPKFFKKLKKYLELL